MPAPSTRVFTAQWGSKPGDLIQDFAVLKHVSLAVCAVLALSPLGAAADLVSLTASGTIMASDDVSIPVGTPWTFDVTYDTSAPDLDFNVTGSPTPTFGEFTNTGAPPALVAFHYRAGSYRVAIESAGDFGPGSGIFITFDRVHAIDINIDATSLFPFLGGGPVFFHADFNDFSSRPIFVSDALPTDPELGPTSFDEVAVSLLLPPTGEVSGFALTSFAVRPVPEPSVSTSMAVGALSLPVAWRSRSRRGRPGPVPGPGPVRALVDA